MTALLFVLTGIFSGIVAGLLGVGGGLIFIPLASLYFFDYLNYPPEFLKVIIATSTAIIVANSLSSTIAHQRKKNIDLKLLPWFVGASILGSKTGVLLIDILPVATVRCILAGFLIFAGVRILRGRDPKADDRQLKTKQHAQIGVIAYGVSTLSGMLGLGGGAIMAPVLNVVYLQPIKRAIGTAALFTFTVSSTACLYYLLEPTLSTPTDHIMVGYVDIQIAALTGAGGVAGSWLGARLLHRSPIAVIQKIFGVLLLLSAAKLMF